VSGVRLIEAKPEDLCPTQMTVGYDEAAFKREIWKVLTGEEKIRFLAGHPFPAVAGPNRRYYILDGHHLGRAFLEEGVEAVYLCPSKISRTSIAPNFGRSWNGAIWSIPTRWASGAISKIFLRLYEIWRTIRFAALWRRSIGLAVMERTPHPSQNFTRPNI
jgi:hypothetical protein